MHVVEDDLYAKAMAVMNRSRGTDTMQKMRKGDIEVDVRMQQVFVKGKRCQLAPIEYKLLVFFLENPNRIFSREQIYGLGLYLAKKIFELHNMKISVENTD